MSEKNYTNCPLCNHYKLKNIFKNKFKNSSYQICEKCHLIFKNPLESPEKTIKRYGFEYFKYEKENQYNFFNLVKKTLADFNILSIIPKNANVLEIGSATGLFLKYMEENGHTAIGLEVCKESVEYGRKNYNVNLINKKLEEMDFENECFDFIHFSHLIEHLNDPFNFLRIIHRILKPDGYVLLTTPNSNGLFAKYYGENWRCLVDDHLFIFNKKNLKLLLKKLNFKVLKIKTWGSIPKEKGVTGLKKFFDFFVKITGTGDVLALLVRKI